MKTAAALLAVTVALIGCNATTQQVRRPGPADDPTTHCFQKLEQDDRFAALRPKVGSVVTSREVTLEMLASQERASEEDKRLISMWAVARQTCFDQGRQFRAQYAPPGWAKEIEAGNTAGVALMARLYSGELTYGEFNRARQELAAKTTAALNSAVDRAEAAHRDRSAQEQAANLQALQTMQLLQAMQPKSQPIPLPQPPVICNSNRFGNTVNTVCN